ncbi:SDR family NAD(P)-dependent oxidoreductase [Streptomyces massasporeus]
MTALKGANVFVTDGSRGIGKALVEGLCARRRQDLRHGPRPPRSVTHPDAVPVALEVIVLINNAGAAVGASFLDSPVDDIRHEFETNFYGPLLLTRAFVPVIEGNGGGHILNVHSVLSWLALGGSCSASKAARWSQTNSLRLELQPRGIGVTGPHGGYVDTDLAADVDAPKSDPRDVAALALDGIETGAYEVLADDVTRQVKAGLAGDLAALYPN